MCSASPPASGSPAEAAASGHNGSDEWKSVRNTEFSSLGGLGGSVRTEGATAGGGEMGLWGPGGASAGPKGAGVARLPLVPAPLEAPCNAFTQELGAECFVSIERPGQINGWALAASPPPPAPLSLTSCGRQTSNRSSAAVSQGP